MRSPDAWFGIWQQRRWINWLLLPLSGLARTWWWLRRLVIQPQEVPAAVVVVGNLWPGGTGKTPIVMALVKGLQSQGFKVGVLSRGHGRTSDATALIRPNSLASEVGDEPLLIHRNSQAPVAVGRSRVAAAQLLLRHHPEVQVLICDDGLQHLQLAHDLALVVMDERGLGNGWMLPAGPLREPWPRAPRARCQEWILSHGAHPSEPAVEVQRKLAQVAINGDGELMTMAQLASQPLAAVCGIAKPQAFFSALELAGCELMHTEAFPDHHDFADWVPTQWPASQWVCTEKDAVKIWQSHPQVWAVPLVCELPADFWPGFIAAIESRLRSLHGSKNA